MAISADDATPSRKETSPSPNVLTQVLAQGAFEPLGRRPLNILQDSPPMPTSQEMHKIVAARLMVQANL